MNEDTRHIIPHKISWALVGLVVGPLIAIGVYVALGSAADLSDPARRLAAVATLMALWWVLESVPLAVTALLPIVLFPLLEILPIEATTARYAHKLIFLFMGGLFLGVGLQRWNAHKRIALLIILLVGTSPKRLVGGVMLASGVLSAFVSNTATAMMMLPIVLAVGSLAVSDHPDHPHAKRYTSCLLLALAYGASIGGIATLTGTPPNGFLAGFMAQSMNTEMSYARWLFFGVPFVLVMLPIAWIYLVYVAAPVNIRPMQGGRAMIHKRLRELGPVTKQEILTLSVFSLTALLWMTHTVLERQFGMPAIDDATIAIGGAFLLFIIPSGAGDHTRLLRWADAESIPWGILILFGGGLALAEGVTNTRLDVWIGSQISNMGNPGMLPLIIGVSVLVVFLTSFTSNTATASTMLPILAAVGEGLDTDPSLLLVAATISASCAFMLPVATPPNAIVFSSGKLSIKHMAVAGFGLNLIAASVISLMVWGLARPLLNL